MALNAHTPNRAGRWHLLGQHVETVATEAARYAKPFDGGHLAHWIGLFHDVGKSSDEFQRYLNRCAVDPKHRERIDHKAAGALLTIGVCDALALLIQGHHGGLPDRRELKSKVNEWRKNPGLRTVIQWARTEGVIPNDVPARLDLPAFATDKRSPGSTEFFLRMLFSALVDADHADTELHFDPDKAAERGGTPDLETLDARLGAAQEALAAEVAAHGREGDPVNLLRRDVYDACLAAAELPPGFFRLTVPTGGGKTRSGLAFALRHALRHELRRVIVAVPFLTITEQTVDVYRQVLGDDRAVLEHHSGAGERVGDRDEQGEATPSEVWRRLAAQDWDAPVIVTTTVQLFESLFGRTPSICRKLHRLARSVIVLDEAQTLPIPLLAPILDGLRELTTNYGTSVVLCTATQPEFAAAPGLADLAGVREIAPDPPRLFSVLKRVDYEWPEEPWTWVQVADEMRATDRVLAIVNTKANALALLDALGNRDVLHLSTLLCGAHRRDVLAIVRERLRRGEPCRLVSTQVVEAGVDLDFPVVLRAMGPLEAIIQAAGRCNREGRLSGRGRVVVFRPENGGTPGSSYRTATDATKTLLARGEPDLDHPGTFARYSADLLSLLGGSLDAKGIQQMRSRLAFEEVAANFQMIEEDAVSVLVPYKGMHPTCVGNVDLGAEQDHKQTTSSLIAAFRTVATGQGRPGGARDVLRRAQPYLVSIRKREVDDAVKAGAATEVVEGLWIWEGGYDDVRGLTLDRPPEELVVG